MYENIKYRIKIKDDVSMFFPCLSGDRQGENLSPLLFSFYLNDLENFLKAHSVNGIKSEAVADGFYQFLKYSLYCMQMILFC